MIRGWTWLSWGVVLLAVASCPGEGLAETCELAPELLASEAACAGEGPGKTPSDVCAWLVVLRHLAVHDADAAESALLDFFALAPEDARDLLEAPAKWMGLLVDERTCSFEAMRPFIDAAIEGQARGEPEASLVIARLLGVPPEGIAGLLRDRGEERRRSSTRALLALAETVAPVAAMQEVVAVARHALDHPVAAPQLETWPAELEGQAPLFESIDEVLAGGAHPIRSKFSLLADVAACTDSVQSQSWLWTRAGLGLVQFGHLEEAAAALHVAEELFQAQDTLDGATRLVRMAGGGLRMLLSRLLELTGEAERIEEELARGASTLESWWLEGLVATPLYRVEVQPAFEVSSRFQRELLERSLAGDFEAAELEALGRALLIAMPGLAASTPPASQDGERPPEALGAAFSLLAGNLAEALRSWEVASAGSWHLDFVQWPLLISVEALRRGRVDAAAIVFERGLAFAERIFESQQVDSVSRVRVERAAAFYRPAVELALARGQTAESFAYAERGRSFVLRRRLGAPWRAARGRSSSEERVLHSDIVRRLRLGERDEQLAAAMHRFAALRLERRLRAAVGDEASRAERKASPARGPAISRQQRGGMR